MPDKMPVLPNGMRESKIPEQTDYANIPNRLTITDRVYYQEIGEPIYDSETRYALDLKTKNHQVYEKRMRAGEGWKPLDIQWQDMDGNPITECSMMIIRNDEGHFQHKVPSEQEKAEAQERVLEITEGALADPIWVVLPKTDMRCQPFELGKFQVRSRKGNCRFTLILIPA